MTTLTSDDSECPPSTADAQYVLPVTLQLPSRSHTFTNHDMSQGDNKLPWTDADIIRYEKELRTALSRLTANSDGKDSSSSNSCFSCCFKKRRQPPREMIHANEEDDDQKARVPEMIDIGNGDRPLRVASIPIPNDDDRDKSATGNRRASVSFNDRLVRTPRGSAIDAKDNELNSGILETTNAFLELLQLDTMSKHLQEMRDRRMFLEKAANDADLPEGERQIAAWITDTYLCRSPTSHYPQTILENIIKSQNKVEHHEAHSSEPMEIIRAQSEDLENKEIAAIVQIAPSPILKDRTDRAIELLQICGDWNFPVFEYAEICQNSTLALLMGTICKSQSYLSNLNVPISTLMAYMKMVDIGYKDNPYHNHIHAADVLLNMHYFMKSAIFNNNISTLDAFAILVSSAVHDVGHPGHNNHFEINTESTYAVRYNDVSVLENMHISVAWSLLKNPKCNILCNMDKEQRKRFRKVMIDSVLATDMSQHSVHSETLEKLVEDYGETDYIDAEDRATNKFADEFLPIALHTADLGNLCKEIKYYSEWVDRLMNEFFKQGDKERERGLPISFLCDRVKVNIHSGQVGFINFVIRPWFTKFGMLLKEDSHNKLWLQHLNENLKYMHDQANVTKLAQEEIQKKEQDETPVPTQLEAGSDLAFEVVLRDDTLDDVPDNEKVKVIIAEQAGKVQDPESMDTVEPLPNMTHNASKKPVIYSIGDDENPSYSRMSKSYSIVGLTFPEMKTKLAEYEGNER